MLLFLQNERGAVTIDWVALTAGGLLLGLALVWGIFNNGVDPVVDSIQDSLSAVQIIAPGSAPNLTD